MALDLLGADESVTGVRETVQGLLDMARGLGLANLLTDDSARRTRVVTQWADLIETALDRWLVHPHDQAADIILSSPCPC